MRLSQYQEADWLGRYDSVTASWNTTYPRMPTPRAMLGLVALNDVLYAIGGTPGGNSTGPCPTATGKPCAEPKPPSGAVEIFDPRTRKWTKGRPLLTPRWGLAVVTSDGVIYAIGGYGNPTATDRDAGSQVDSLHKSGAHAVASQVVEVLNPAESNAWTRTTNMVCRRAFASAAVLPYDGQGVLFVTGGRNSTSLCKKQTMDLHALPASIAYTACDLGVPGSCAAAAMTYMEAYFPRNTSWVEKAPLPVRLARPCSSATLCVGAACNASRPTQR